MTGKPIEPTEARPGQRGLVLGIDASNIRSGGGLTHLAQLLGAAAPHESSFARVVVWADGPTLSALPEAPWLEKAHARLLGGSSAQRALWREACLPNRLRAAGVDVLLAPGGTLPRRRPCPAVTMSQNLLPFDPREAARQGLWRSALRYALLRRVQSRSFLEADGLIFLTGYARRFVCDRLGREPCSTAIIPHGVEARFRLAPRPQKPPGSFSDEEPFRFLYVSIVHFYKHQWHVAEAVGKLRANGLAVAIDFVGPAFGPALDRLRRAIGAWDPAERHIRYLGPVPFAGLHEVYHRADGFVFASTCENMPNILLEAQASGLAIACANREPMVGMLGEGGVYFEPESPDDIARALRALFENPELRERCARTAYARAQAYSWARCARETLDFVVQVAAA